MKSEYVLVQRPRTNATDIVRRMISPKDEWYFVATIASVETARELVRLLNLGAEITDQEEHRKTRRKTKP